MDDRHVKKPEGNAAEGDSNAPSEEMKGPTVAKHAEYPQWTERYRPNSLEQIVGNSRAVAELKQWADEWEHGKPSKKAVILAGAPGTGKTSAAMALAKDMKWGILELNASDARNYAAIKRVAFSGAVHDTFSDDGQFISSRQGGRKLIVLDEADSLYESVEKVGGDKKTGKDSKDIGDRGGKKAIVETVSKTRQPVMLIVNDSYALTSAGGEALRSLCLTIKFDRVHKNAVRAALRRICESESINATPEALEELSARAKGDLRAAINDLQSLTEATGVLRLDMLKALGGRDERENIFDVVRDILKGTTIEKARSAMRRIDEPPEFVMLWLDENVPYEYRLPDDLERAYEALSRADVFLGRVSRRQQYGLWAYASDMMSAGVALAKRGRYREFIRYRFPVWLSARSRSSGARRLEKEVLHKIGDYAHESIYTCKHQLLPLFRRFFDSDREFAVKFIRELNLEEMHVGVLLDTDMASPRVRELMDAASFVAPGEVRTPKVREFRSGKWSESQDEDGEDDDEGEAKSPEVGKKKGRKRADGKEGLVTTTSTAGARKKKKKGEEEAGKEGKGVRDAREDGGSGGKSDSEVGSVTEDGKGTNDGKRKEDAKIDGKGKGTGGDGDQEEQDKKQKKLFDF